jgi:hypothetical protein
MIENAANRPYYCTILILLQCGIAKLLRTCYKISAIFHRIFPPVSYLQDAWVVCGKSKDLLRLKPELEKQ